MQNLWGERVPRRRHRRKRNVAIRTLRIPYSITGSNDCEIIGHTLSYFDLSGCTTCLDCGANIFCPRCVSAHPLDETAIPVLCERHEQESEVTHAV